MQKIIVGNLKMNLLSISERERYFESFKKELKARKISNSQIVLCPPAVHLESFVKKMKTKEVAIGVQNIFWEERGSFTGEISAKMIKELGGGFVIVGHSERRRYFGETNTDANEKIRAALKAGLVPIYCIGETREERAAGNTVDVIAEQVAEGLAEISPINIKSVVIAYEPVWAVGSDLVPTSDEILEVKIMLKKIFSKIQGLMEIEKIKIIYGGSVNSKTIHQVCIDPAMDGVLVGRESLIPSELVKIAETIENS